ncbi:MAG: DUF1326 domain-containing protein [Thermoproteota archaeon]|nr:DUF1326 domain-containing protein [Thermoproteota archaeon]
MFCPCWFGVKELMIMDKGYCGGLILFRIQDGISNSINLAGRDVVLFFDWPGPTLLDGNGTSRLYIDDTADTNQQKEFEYIFQGRRGGPMQMLSQLIAKWLPTITTRIDIKEDDGGHNITARVGNQGEIKSQQLRNEAGRAMTVHGAGFASMFQFENDVLTLAPSGTQWSDSDMPHTQITTRSGALGKFSWRGN